MDLSKDFKIKRVGQLSVSVIDQGLYSINNFLLNILLARTISSTAYGEYSVAFSIFLFISGFQNALITEPMSVLGPIKFHKNYKKYFTILIVLNFLITFSASFLVILFVNLFSLGSISSVIISMAIILPFLLNFWLVRRFCYMIEKPGNALAGTLTYTLLLLTPVFILIKNHTLNGPTSFYLMGVSGLVTSILSTFFILYQLRTETLEENISFQEVISDHWKYGKWATGSSIVYWLNSAVIVPFTALFVGYSDAGVFRALQNFTLPIQQFITALSNYLLPNLSHQNQTTGTQAVKIRIKKVLYFTLSAVIGYVILLIAFRKSLILLVYPKNDYINFDWLILYLGIALIFDSATQILSISLRAFQRPDAIFWSQLGGVIAFAGLGSILISQLHLSGAGWTQIGLSTINFVLIVFFYKSIKAKGSTLEENSFK